MWFPRSKVFLSLAYTPFWVFGAGADFAQKPSFHKLLQAASGCAVGDIPQARRLCRADLPVFFKVFHQFRLPKMPSLQRGAGALAVKRDPEAVADFLKPWRRDSGIAASRYHPADA